MDSRSNFTPRVPVRRPPALGVNFLSKRFGDTIAVDGVDLHIPAGRMVGIIGRSGAGKSTLLRLLNRLIDPSGGAISFGDTDVSGLKGRAIVTDGKAEPLAAEIDKDGGFGYFGVIIVKKDSPFKSVDDLKGKRFGFADPNSTSGHQAPRYFLGEAGYDVDNFFGSTTFSGSHENSVKMLYDGQFDAVATWWTNEKKSNMSRMEEKGMIEAGQYRIIWKSPRLPSDPFTVPAWLPREMKADIKDALVNFHKNDPEAFRALMGGSQRLREVSLEDYQPVIRFIKANMENRKG